MFGRTLKGERAYIENFRVIPGWIHASGRMMIASFDEIPDRPVHFIADTWQELRSENQIYTYDLRLGMTEDETGNKVAMISLERTNIADNPRESGEPLRIKLKIDPNRDTVLGQWGKDPDAYLWGRENKSLINDMELMLATGESEVVSLALDTLRVQKQKLDENYIQEYSGSLELTSRSYTASKGTYLDVSEIHMKFATNGTNAEVVMSRFASGETRIFRSSRSVGLPFYRAYALPITHAKTTLENELIWLNEADVMDDSVVQYEELESLRESFNLAIERHETMVGFQETAIRQGLLLWISSKRSGEPSWITVSSHISENAVPYGGIMTQGEFYDGSDASYESYITAVENEVPYLVQLGYDPGRGVEIKNKWLLNQSITGLIKDDDFLRVVNADGTLSQVSPDGNIAGLDLNGYRLAGAVSSAGNRDQYAFNGEGDGQTMRLILGGRDFTLLDMMERRPQGFKRSA